MTVDQLKAGTKVTYCPDYGPTENGIVKAVRGNIAFVVYKCGGNWDDYQNYTGAATDIADLEIGWNAKRESISE